MGAVNSSREDISFEATPSEEMPANLKIGMIKEILQNHWVTCGMSALTHRQCSTKWVTAVVMTADDP